MTTATAAEGRHASWLELFFDLVIVAAVAQLAHLLHDGTGPLELFQVGALYFAIWSIWTQFTLYANVEGEQTRRRPMLVAMFGIAVMAAAVPKVAHGDATVFIVAYVVCRTLANTSWSRTGKILTVWPAAQAGAGLVPWIVSIWVDAPGRYWLWALGIALDIVAPVLMAGNPAGLLAQVNERYRRVEERNAERAARSPQRQAAYEQRVQRKAERQSERDARRRRAMTVPTEASLDWSHFNERLGLFVIIVLGEAVVQVVGAAAEVPWTDHLWWVVLAGFGLLVCFWWQTLNADASIPEHDLLPPRVTLPAHYAMTAGIIGVAAGLGATAEHTDHLSTAVRWVLCGGAALYFAVRAVLGLLGGASRRWLLGWALPAVVVPMVLGLAGGHLASWTVVGVLLATAGWQVLYPRLTGTGEDGADAEPGVPKAADQGDE
ncbi:MAG: low temperature requirement protein A [Hamadaea sp.]|nr:low temperature requirement protein A [Hamadaea sp.]